MLDFRNDRADIKSESAKGSRPYFVDMADKSLLSDTRKSNKAKTSDDGMLEFDNAFGSTTEPQTTGAKGADDASPGAKPDEKLPEHSDPKME